MSEINEEARAAALAGEAPIDTAESVQADREATPVENEQAVSALLQALVPQGATIQAFLVEDGVLVQVLIPNDNVHYVETQAEAAADEADVPDVFGTG